MPCNDLAFPSGRPGDFARREQLAGAIKVGGVWRVSREKLEVWIEANNVDAAAERSESERGSNDKP